MIFEGSRYEGSSVKTLPAADGTHRATIVPCCPRRAVVSYSTHRVVHGDRLDMLAAGAYGDAEQWWRIADANPEVEYPGELPLGVLIRIPSLPRGDEL